MAPRTLATYATPLLFLSMQVSTAPTIDNGFQKTPVMGWNTYNAASCNINETYVRSTINELANSIFPNLGYRYYQADCGWQGYQRDQNGALTYDHDAFPNGITPLSNLATSKRLKWAMYTDQGVYACDVDNRRRPGSLGHEKEDAVAFASWNASLIKIDNCWPDADHFNPHDPRTDFVGRYTAMADALNNVGIKGQAICQWGVPYSSSSGLEGPGSWAPSIGTSFRMSDDIAQGWENIWRIMNQAIHINLRNMVGPGAFPDLDLLEVGNPGMSDAEQTSHFAIWALFKSPLMISTPLSRLSSSAKAALSNKDIIAINQDSLGKPVTLVQRYTNDYDVFSGPLLNGDVAVLLLDTSNQARTLTVSFSKLGIISATVKDLWTGTTKSGARTYSSKVQAHGSTVLRLSNIKKQSTSAPKLTVIEAESGKLTGSAQKLSCSGCSGSSKVGFIGQGASLTLSNVRTSQVSQDVRFDYVQCDVSLDDGGNANVLGASISVNGGSGQSVLFPLTGYNWDTDVAKSHLVRLSGFKTNAANTITIGPLSGSTEYAPDFDRIAVLV